MYISTNNIATGMVAVASTLSIHEKYVFNSQIVFFIRPVFLLCRCCSKLSPDPGENRRIGEELGTPRTGGSIKLPLVESEEVSETEREINGSRS
jgi:hypothetical protein